MEDGLARLQHIGQPGARAQIPQTAAFNGTYVPARVFFQKFLVSLVAENDAALGIDDGDALPHGVEGGSGGGVEFHSCTSQVLLL